MAKKTYTVQMSDDKTGDVLMTTDGFATKSEAMTRMIEYRDGLCAAGFFSFNQGQEYLIVNEPIGRYLRLKVVAS